MITAMPLFPPFLLCLSLVTSLHLRQSTSLGLLASDVDTLNSNLVTLGDQAVDDGDTRDRLADTGFAFSNDVYSGLLNSEIMDRQDDLRAAQQQADRVRSELEDMGCSRWGSCDGCSGDKGCVWCSAERVCVSGDDRGPLAGECTDFRTSCGCEDAEDCQQCQRQWNCAWCAADDMCLSAGDYCDQWQSQDCPATAERSDFPLDPEAVQMQRDLSVSVARAADLQRELALLQSQLEATLTQTPPSDPSFRYAPPPPLQGFSTRVDAASQSQRKQPARTAANCADSGRRSAGG